jgi:hypothetical protein
VKAPAAILLCLAALAGAAGTAGSAPTHSTGARTVPCGESIDLTRFPYVGDRRPQHRYRLVLGVASAPPAFMEQVVETGEQPWTHWRKQGLVIRGGAGPVTVSVPAAWRTRAAIKWGYGGHGQFRALTFGRCGDDRRVGYAYAGGFLLSSATACVPLAFRVGAHSTTVRFGLGRRCP